MTFIILVYGLQDVVFHRAKKFGDSDSDESDSDVEIAEKESAKGDRRRIYQRFHA